MGAKFYSFSLRIGYMERQICLRFLALESRASACMAHRNSKYSMLLHEAFLGYFDPCKCLTAISIYEIEAGLAFFKVLLTAPAQAARCSRQLGNSLF